MEAIEKVLLKYHVEDFLNFRKLFTKRQWQELNQTVDAQLNKKADQLTLDDSDIQIISERLERFISRQSE